jgi:hypothetical protein
VFGAYTYCTLLYRCTNRKDIRTIEFCTESSGVNNHCMHIGKSSTIRSIIVFLRGNFLGVGIFKSRDMIGSKYAGTEQNQRQ